MRGKPGPLGLLPVAGRIIPARAGQTRCRSGNILYPPDHPRACGANLASRRFHNGLSGSSPRVRGKLKGVFAGAGTLRIIPARAGQTRSMSPHSSPYPDHPRACGANENAASVAVAESGSSPRVRGKRRCPRVTSPVNRIIPARAGQTGGGAHRVGRGADHPRACGANTCVHD